MTEDVSFTDFIRRIRAGDERAAEDIIRQYEPIIRREVRLRLHDPRLFSAFDSMDICRSVLKSFFLRVAAGQYDLDSPRDLLRLLIAMARHKLAFQVRKERSQRRDRRRVAGRTPEELELATPTPDPGEQVEGRELLEEFRRRLSDEARHLADLRAQGVGWAEIATQLVGTPQARRMQLTAADNRVVRELDGPGGGGLGGASPPTPGGQAPHTPRVKRLPVPSAAGWQ